jgi:hypothetical protein
MYKCLIICVIIILQSCSSVKKVKVPTEYPIGISFNSACCGTPSQEPICDYISNFLRQNKIKNINILYQPCRFCEEGEYWLYFPLNDVSELQKKGFIIEMTNIVKNIRPKSENEGTVEIIKWGKTSKNKWLDWALVSYDSTMKCPIWSNLVPLAGSPYMLKLSR